MFDDENFDTCYSDEGVSAAEPSLLVFFSRSFPQYHHLAPTIPAE
jgi:hypothetical protein